MGKRVDNYSYHGDNDRAGLRFYRKMWAETYLTTIF